MNGDELLTSICLCTHVKNPKRLSDLTKVYTSLLATLAESAEVIIVDDCSILRPQVEILTRTFTDAMALAHPDIPVKFVMNETNLGHPRSQNLSMDLAKGGVLVHIEDDIFLQHVGWNRVFARCLADHPEVGQVLPNGSGRGEWIPRSGYDEFMWGIGGLFAIRRDVFEKVGGWEEDLVHQIEPSYNFLVRMAGWRLAQIKDFPMIHLGEGDEADTFERQALIHVGVYNFLKKWNRRFFGTFAYSSVWTQSMDDFPINVAFRRQLAAWYVAQAYECDRVLADTSLNLSDVQKTNIKMARDDFMRCRMNENPEIFIYPTHYGKFEKVNLIRQPGREREDELIEKMRNNFVFGNSSELHQQIFDLAKRMGKDMTHEQVSAYLVGKEHEYVWEAETTLVGENQ